MECSYRLTLGSTDVDALLGLYCGDQQQPTRGKRLQVAVCEGGEQRVNWQEEKKETGNYDMNKEVDTF